MTQNLTYTQCGDYYFPDIRLAHTETQSLGKYGRMRRTFLEQNKPMLFKATQQLEWVAHMNSLKAQAEEIILRELVYGEDVV